MIQIQLLGPFKVFHPDGSEMRLRSHRSLIARIAAAKGAPVPRKTILFDAWPGVPLEVAQNRFRVALSTLRKVLGEALVESSDGIALHEEFVDSDLARVEREIADVENEVDEASERRRLGSLIPLLERRFVSDVDEPWVNEFQTEWQHLAQQQLLRVIELGWKGNDFRLVSDAASAALAHEPGSDDFWMHYLKVKVRLGESAEAIKEFLVARSKLQADEDTDFSEDVLDFAKQIRLGNYNFETARETAMSPLESEFLSHLFEQYFVSEPESLAVLLGNRAYLAEQCRYVVASHGLLDRLLCKLEKGSTAWLRVHLARLDLAGIINKSPLVIEMWDEVKSMEMSNPMRATYLDIVSFARFTLRDYRGAIRDVEEMIGLLSEDKNGAQRLLTNKASFLWHLGDFEEADRLYQLSTEACEGMSGPGAQIRLSANQLNQGFSRIMQGKLEESLPYLEEASEVLQTLRHETGIAMSLSALGYVRFAVLDDVNALKMTCRGLKLSYHLKFERSQQIALDYAAAAFAHAGEYGMAQSVIDYATKWRDRTDHAFSVAESMLRDRTLAACSGNVRVNNYLDDLSVPDVLCEVVRNLRAIENRKGPEATMNSG
ncbi:MAG: hypothetical protein KF812_12965 [Fimbriimonadaceae bacterium]|nr:hypothetical protein [Fimbriimonadaceae bacterium]